jgi:thiol:disulfide interchange protein DsbD
MAEGWWTYPTRQPVKAAEESRNQFTFFPSEDFVFAGDLVEPQAKRKTVTGLEGPDVGTTVLYLDGDVVFERKLVVRPEATPGEKKVKVRVRVIVCDKFKCLSPVPLDLEAPLTVTSDPPVAVEEPYRAALTAGPMAPSPEDSKPAPPSAARPDTDVLGFILLGAFWGAISLLTPCVFPMIPITVSFFLKQSEKEHHRPLSMAIVYCSTIVIVLTVGAVVLLGFFQAASQHWLTNLVLGLLFVIFALSLFGMYELTLPSGLANFTSSRQARGGMSGTIFMALTFSIISFSCVAPFMGGFAALVPSFGNVVGMIKAGDLARLLGIFATLLLGALAFSVTFALPFFFLALFPSLLRKMPKSGTWMNTIKVVMGFLELAAAVKFLRATELLAFGEAQLLTYDLALGLYVAISLACGVYLLGLFRLGHDDPIEHLGVPRMIVGVLFLSLALYLAPGLFRIDAERKQRPTGAVFAWLDSFLLPETSSKGHLGSLAEGLREAQDKRKLVFIDFTGLS